jgi:hypothetical protein
MRRISLTLVLALSVLGCSDDSKTPTDGPVKLDKGITPDQTVIPPMACASPYECKDFVFNNLIVPMNNTDAQKYAFSFGGKTYNALGTVLALIASQVQSLDLQASITGAINSGKTLVLVRLQAKSWTDDSATTGKTWIGAQTTCCAKPDDKPACATEAATTCFNGTKEFTPDPKSTGAPLSGKIAAGALSLGATSMALQLPITSAGTLDITLDSVQVSGTMAAGSPDKVTNGKLAGAMSVDQVNNKLLPTIADMMTTTLQDPTTSQSTIDQIQTLFDTDKNKTVTKEELQANGIIATILAGDVDLDGDKKADHLSLGIGFEAIKAVIKDK